MRVDSAPASYLRYTMRGPACPFRILVALSGQQEGESLAAGADQILDGFFARLEVVVAETAHSIGQAGAVGVGQRPIAEEVQQHRAGRLDLGFLQRFFGVDEFGVGIGGAGRDEEPEHGDEPDDAVRFHGGS